MFRENDDNIHFIFGPCIRAAIESNPIDRGPEISRLQLAAGGALLLLAPEFKLEALKSHGSSRMRAVQDSTYFGLLDCRLSVIVQH